MVTIIVGVATVVAINTFSAAADSANLDAVRQDLASIAASAQGYYMKPKMMGGGGNSFADISFDNITFPGEGSGTSASNENGDYSISVSGSAPQNFLVTATPSSGGTTIQARVCADAFVVADPGDDAPSDCSSVSSG